jgi:hypothetical protein
VGQPAKTRTRGARRARECERASVQFLDDSVALSKNALAARQQPARRIYREYSFDYSSVGDDRQAGRVYLLGERVLTANLIA